MSTASACVAATGETSSASAIRATIGKPKFERGELFARFEADTLDSVSFPRSGTVARMEWRGSRTGLGSGQATSIRCCSRSPRETWGRHTLVTTFRYDTTMSGDPPLNRLFTMGGFLDCPGSVTTSWRGRTRRGSVQATTGG